MFILVCRHDVWPKCLLTSRHFVDPGRSWWSSCACGAWRWIGSSWAPDDTDSPDTCKHWSLSRFWKQTSTHTEGQALKWVESVAGAYSQICPHVNTLTWQWWPHSGRWQRPSLRALCWPFLSPSCSCLSAVPPVWCSSWQPLPVVNIRVKVWAGDAFNWTGIQMTVNVTSYTQSRWAHTLYTVQWMRTFDFCNKCCSVVWSWNCCSL